MIKPKEINSVWIYGNGGFAKEVKRFLQDQQIEVFGHITHAGFEVGEIHGDESLYQKNRLPIVIGVFNHRDDPVEILEFLEKINPVSIITLASLMNMFKGEGFNKYYLDSNFDQMNIIDNRAKIVEKLQDEESVRVLDGFIDYRANGDVRQLIRSGSASDQYLGTTLPPPYDKEWLSGPLKWFDIGSFDGDTLRAIQGSGRNMKLDFYVCAEPDILNFQKLQVTTDNLETTSMLLNVAIGDTPGEIDFIHEGTLSAKQSATSSNQDLKSTVKVETIDQICESFEPTHIKMDIEGAELSAIRGGLKTLKNARPKIAVSLYHKPSDVIDLCTILMDHLEGYSWFIRCYGAHGYDTILYGVPK